MFVHILKAVVRRCSVKKWSLKFREIHRKTPQACNLIKNETLIRVLTCEFCEIFRITFFQRIPPVAASIILTSKRSFKDHGGV